MKRNSRPVIASVAALAITGGVLAASIGTAAAAGGPTWEPDPNSLGSLTFYTASGTIITGGTNLNHLFDYARASTADAEAGLKATLIFANPTPGSPTGSWPTGQASGSNNTPPAGAPASLNTSSTPVASSTNGTDANLTSFIGGNTANTQAGYANVYQVRVVTSGGPNGGSNADSTYWEDDIQVNPATGSWWEIFPAVAIGGATTLTSQNLTNSGAPSNTATQGDNVKFIATETAFDGTHPAGSVQFKDNGSNIGSAVAVNGSGVATVSTTSSPVGSDAITAVFTPTTPASYSGSTGSLTETVNAPEPTTSTTLTITGNTTTGTDAVLSGVVSASDSNHPPGTVNLFDNGSSTPLNPSPLAVSTTDGSYSFTLSGGFAAGSHSVVAKFTPTNPANYLGSQSPAVQFVTNQPAGTPCATQPQTGCTDTQTVTTTIPAGTLSISTPYTDNAPLNITNEALSADGTYWTGNATFQCIIITDTTSGGSPFVASALANPLSLVPGTSVGNQHQSNAFTTINAENVGLTSFRHATANCPDGLPPVNSYAQPIAATDQAAALGVPPSDTGSAGLGGSTPHTLLTGTAGGTGTATIDGTLTINAPTSTHDGQYKGTIVFTVTD